MADATIITASLDSTELQNSVTKLVNSVNEGLNTIKNNFDKTISDIQNGFKNIGNVSSSGGSAQRTNDIKKEIQARKELKTTLDEQAAALQKASQPKSARDSFYAFVQGLKQQEAELKQLVRSWENLMLNRQIGRADSVTAQIDATKAKIRELKDEITWFRSHYPGTDYAHQQIKLRELDIDELKRKIKELEAEYKRINEQNPFRGQAGQEYLTRAHQRLAETKRLLSELTEKQQQSTSATQQQTQAQQQQTQAIQQQAAETQKKVKDEQQYSEEVRKSAEALRAQLAASKQGWINVGGQTIYRDSEQSSIEGQLTALVANRTKEFNLQAATVKAIEEDEKRITAELEKQANTLTKRSKYNAPDVKINEQFRSMVQWKMGDEQLLAKAGSSINSLNTYLKQLTETYNKLTGAERTTPFGRQLREEIQGTERAIAKLRSEMSRPISLQSIIGIKPQTIDEMTQKLQMLKSYKRGINIADPNSSLEIEKVDRAIIQLQKDLNKYINTTSKAVSANGALGRSWNYMKNRLAFYFTVGASTQFVKSLIDIRGQYELLERSIGILIDSAQQGSQIFSELNAMAIKSPFTTMELGAAAKQLVAYDLAAKDVVDTTRRLADMAAAVGIPIERLTYALGQIKAYGYLNARDARMFANAGIPLVKELSDYYTHIEGQLVSTSDVYDRIKKKAIDYKDVMLVINKMTDEGGKFFNFQEKAADTLKVKIANLTLAWNNMLNEMGKSNQGLLSGTLVALKGIFEHWRDIENILLSIIANYSLIKAYHIWHLLHMQKEITAARTLAIIQKTLGKGAANFAAVIGNGISSLANPATLAVAAITAISVALGKLTWDYHDLVKANNEFNRSIADNAEENINSIDKFFKDYKKQLETIGGENEIEQTKMWERISEEIEKSSKNAEEFIDILRKTPNIADRINIAKGFLDQTQTIEKEVQRLANIGSFSLGGGFADDSLADNLKQYEDALTGIRKEYGSLSGASESYTLKSRKLWADYTTQLTESQNELRNFTDILSNADLDAIMGDSENDEVRLANLREYARIVRDNFLATEKGQKVTTEGQALLNSAIDQWVAYQGVYFGLIKDKTIAEQQYTQDAIRGIEEQRSAWETFFDQLNSSDRERLEYMIDTNQTGSEEFKEIWDKAARSMEERATTAYNLIQDQIADMRNTPDIVINVVYRTKLEVETDPQRDAFLKRYIKPQGGLTLKPDEYFKQQEENNRKYGRFIKKENEDNVEWEKRLGQAYQDNEKSIKSLNKQLSHSAKLSDVDRQAKEKELQTLKDQNKVLDELRGSQGFDYDQFAKGGKTKKKTHKGSKKDILGEAFSKEVQLIGEMQKRFKEYRDMGVDAISSLDYATKEYNDTLNLQNVVLAKVGVQTLSASKLANMSLRDLRAFYEGQLKMANTLKNAKGIEALEKAIASLNVEITKLDYKKIVDGLNSELGKLKEDYELAVELDANPELGNMFESFFGLTPDVVSSMPHTVGELVDAYQKEINKQLSSVTTIPFNVLTTDIDKWAMASGVSKDSDVGKAVESKQKEIQGIVKKFLGDTQKMVDDYILEYGNLEAQIIKIEKEKNKNLADLDSLYQDKALRKTKEYLDARAAIENSARIKQAKAAFAALKKGSDYDRFFNAINTLSMKDALSIKSKIKKGIVQALKDGGLTAAEFRREIKALEDQFDKLTEPTSNWLNYLDGGFDKLISKARETGQELETIGERINVEGKVDPKDKNFLQSLGSIFSDGKGGKMDFSSLMEKFGSNMKDLGSSVSSAGQNMQSGAKGFQTTLTMIDMIIKNVHQTVQAISAVIDELDSARNEEHKISNAYWEAFKKGDQYAFSGWENLKSGNAAGVVSDVANSIIVIFNGIANAYDEKINKRIKESEREITRLEQLYSKLEDAAEKSLGAAEIGARRAAIENKNLQLAELERQLQLEESRKNKKRDEDAILELQGQIEEAKRDIRDLTEEISSMLLGSDIKSAAEEFVDAWVDAWRAGETTLDAIQEKMDEMIMNMIKKAVTSQIVAKFLKPLYDAVEKYTGDKSAGGNELTPEEIAALAELSKTLGVDINNALGAYYGQLEQIGAIGKSASLSALQQGIQGITEDTAGALEAYMNGVSQQVYLHSDLLTQIRDAVVSFNIDVQTASMGQILLQLQASYQSQQAIQSILEGVLTPSGRAFSVELN